MTNSINFDLCPEFQLRGAGFPSSWPGRLASDRTSDWATRFDEEVRTLQDIYASERLQEAIWWQNPAFAGNVLPALLRGDCNISNSKSRRRLKKFVSYLQRYCAKNEVIGFFGPVGFGHLVSGSTEARDSRGPWLRDRKVYMEPWVVHALWRHFTSQAPQHALLWLSPKVRLEQGVVFDGSASRRANGGRAITEEMQRLLERLKQAPQSTETLLGEGFDEATLTLARRQSWISPLPAIPSNGFPLDWAVQKAQEYHPSIGEPLLKELARFRSCLEQMSVGESRSDRLPHLIQNFQQLIASKNSGQVSRNKGAFYGGRLGFYEEGVRRSMELPAGWVESVLPALGLVLRSARWMALETARTADDLLLEKARKLHRRYGDGYPAVLLWEKTIDIFSKPSLLGFPEAEAELSRRWQQALGEPDLERSEASFSCEEVSRQVDLLFPQQTHSYKGARFHSCDILFTAQGKAVLGEIHPCLFPFQDLSTTLHHPHIETLRSWYRNRREGRDVRPATFVPFTRLHLDGRIDQEAYAVLVDPHHGSWRPASQQVRLGDLTVHPSEERFCLRAPNLPDVDLLDFFSGELSELQSLHFSPFSRIGKGHRVEIGGLVVKRADWALKLSDFSSLQPLETAERISRLNRELIRKDLPAQFFARFPKEVKPLLIVRDSVLFLDLFWSLLVASGECRCSEVLPALDEAWLQTPEGLATGEARFVLFDKSCR